MWKLRRLLPGLAALGFLALSAAPFSFGISPAIAQAPPPVPALPDTERRTTYSISATTCTCSVGFALYGDTTDFGNWIEVFINGVLQASSTYTITSATGPLATIPRPITNAVLTFNAPQTGTVQIVGARRPRRTSQFNENQGVAARDLNQALTDIVAQNRETWDRTNDITGRTLRAPVGETLTTMPSVASRAGATLGFDGSGNPISVTGFIGPQGPAGPTGPAGPGGTAPSVTYTSPGTGAVASTVQARLANELWASDFGAVCNSVTDDHVAFQNMINAGALLHIGTNFTGFCAITAALTISSAAINLNGSGKQTAILLPSTPAMDGIDIIGIPHVTLSNFAIQYTVSPCGTTGSNFAIKISGGAHYSTINNVYILCPQNGIQYSGSGVAELTNTFVAMGQVSTEYGVMYTGANTNDSYINDVIITSNGGSLGTSGQAAIFCQVCSGLKIKGLKVNGAWLQGINVSMTAVLDGDLFMTASSLEGIYGSAVLIARTDNLAEFGAIAMSGNELSGLQCFVIPTDGTGPWIDTIAITGNVCVASSSSGAFSIDSAVNILVANNAIYCGATVPPVVIGSQVIRGVAGPNIAAAPPFDGHKFTAAPLCGTSVNNGTSITTIAPF